MVRDTHWYGNAISLQRIKSSKTCALPHSVVPLQRQALHRQMQTTKPSSHYLTTPTHHSHPHTLHTHTSILA